MVCSRRGFLFVIVKVRNDAPVVLFDVEDEHFAGSVGEAGRTRTESAKNDDGLGFLGTRAM